MKFISEHFGEAILVIGVLAALTVLCIYFLSKGGIVDTSFSTMINNMVSNGAATIKYN